MLTLQEMVIRFVVALALGAILGVEREIVGKEAGVRTEMLVSGGAALFAMLGLMLPYITATAASGTPDTAGMNGALGVIANIVVGIGFLGAGLIIKMNDHPRGITTAALVWMTAAIGALVGVGSYAIAAIAAILTAVLLYLLRAMNISERVNGKQNS